MAVEELKTVCMTYGYINAVAFCLSITFSLFSKLYQNAAKYGMLHPREGVRFSEETEMVKWETVKHCCLTQFV